MIKLFNSIYHKIFKKNDLDSLKKFCDDKQIDISSTKLPSLDGEWLYFGKNHLNSDIYVRIDNITRLPAANLNISVFDRLISNPNDLNDFGDKSTIITRHINHHNGGFKDIYFKIYKKEMGKGKFDTESFNHEQLLWSHPKYNTWDWFFSEIIKQLKYYNLDLEHLALLFGHKKLAK